MCLALKKFSQINRNYLPHPFFFFVPSQLVSSLLEPPPPVLMPPRPLAASRSDSTTALGTVISSQDCSVRNLANFTLYSDKPLQSTCPNKACVACIRWSLSVASRLSLNVWAMMPMRTVLSCSFVNRLWLLFANAAMVSMASAIHWLICSSMALLFCCMASQSSLISGTDSKEVEYAFTYSNHIKLFSNDKHQLFILMKNGIAQIR